MKGFPPSFWPPRSSNPESFFYFPQRCGRRTSYNVTTFGCCCRSCNAFTSRSTLFGSPSWEENQNHFQQAHPEPYNSHLGQKERKLQFWRKKIIIPTNKSSSSNSNNDNNRNECLPFVILIVCFCLIVIVVNSLLEEPTRLRGGSGGPTHPTPPIQPFKISEYNFLLLQLRGGGDHNNKKN